MSIRALKERISNGETYLAYLLNAGSFVCCCVPLGVFGLYFAVQSTQLRAAGDAHGAAAKARIANVIGAVAIAIGIATSVASRFVG